MEKRWQRKLYVRMKNEKNMANTVWLLLQNMFVGSICFLGKGINYFRLKLQCGYLQRRKGNIRASWGTYLSTFKDPQSQ